jgi:Rrf2 family protein
MIQTDSGKYAIRAMAYIAAREEPAEPISAAEVAEAEAIPPYYLAKVLQDLARAGILSSVRGRGGGFKLLRKPEEIPVMEILEAVENIRKLTSECVLGLDECSDEAPCAMHTTWKAFRDRLLVQLEDMTVADLVVELERKRRRLRTRGAGKSKAPA